MAYISQTYCSADTTHSCKRHHFMLDRADIFVIIIILWMTAFSFLRTQYNDTVTYINTFYNADTVSQFWSKGGLMNWAGDPLSMLYRSIMHDISDNYHLYFLFPALLNTIAVIKLQKRYSFNFAFSILLFFSIGTYITYIAALKQSIAMAVLLFALPYAIDRKYIKFYILVFIAILFHTHAFMFAIIPLLFEKPWGKNTFVFAGLTLFAMATYNSTLGTFMEYAQNLGATVVEIEVFDNYSINIIRVAVYAIVPFIAICFRDRLFRESSRTENLFVNMSIISFFILSIGLVQGANLYARMAAYFELGTTIALPWMIDKIFEERSARFMTLIAGGLYFIFFLYEFGISKSFGTNYSAITLWEFIKSLI